MNEIIYLLRRKFKINETTAGKFLLIYCYYDFEPFGRASETFELVWVIEIPFIPYYWHSTTGWRATRKLGMRFTGRKIEDVIDQATKFLNEVE